MNMQTHTSVGLVIKVLGEKCTEQEEKKSSFISKTRNLTTFNSTQKSKFVGIFVLFFYNSHV